MIFRLLGFASGLQLGVQQSMGHKNPDSHRVWLQKMEFVGCLAQPEQQLNLLIWHGIRCRFNRCHSMGFGGGNRWILACFLELLQHVDLLIQGVKKTLSRGSLRII